MTSGEAVGAGDSNDNGGLIAVLLLLTDGALSLCVYNSALLNIMNYIIC